jgi:hypothetical protein
MPRMMVGLVNPSIKNSNATEANESDAGLDALLAEAANCMNSADEVLAQHGYVEVDALAVA